MMRNLTAGALATGLAVVFLLLPVTGAPAAAQPAATVTVEGGQLAGAPSAHR